MNPILKICLVVLMVLPIWLTIVAFAGEDRQDTLSEWRERINSKLLEIKDRRIQISDLLAKTTDFDGLDAFAKFEVDLSGIRNQGISDFSLRFVDSKGGLQKLVRLHAKLFIQDQIAVATHTLNPGEVIDADDFALAWRDTSSFRGSPVNPKDLIGCKVRTLTQENEVIYDGRVQRPHLVARGDRVKISVVGKGLIISGMGIAEEAGTRGQTIKIINNESRKEIFGVVTDLRAVEVRL